MKYKYTSMKNAQYEYIVHVFKSYVYINKQNMKKWQIYACICIYIYIQTYVCIHKTLSKWICLISHYNYISIDM